ncbi:MAG TPA: DUF1554 domain-containing protein [Leptospiraceae bacterium]|nr:DUF1554 domain-containing protein [Leptospiraceae bacterium]HNF14226.1 DUF1554 domain-containing protein [Leptospiraceae bacterium]HNF23186.1 DUF1554 domain-containing protein [Leptospiraceae bacterium]HNM01964.1 DUF1554 domain-containing protein [Leptospiraceae bacterium]HNN03023.1 DUF1554 domain-containing protein [Leptospiraceae bacterium]
MKLMLKSITILSILLLISCTFKKKTAIKFLIPLTSSTSANSSVSGALTSLVPSAGSLSPSFSQTVYSYSITVGSNVSSIQFTPTASDSSVSITINGTSAASGSLSSPVSLISGTNTVTVIAAAVTYTITVTRTATSANLTSLTASPMNFYPSFSSSTSAYTATVSSSISSITLTPVLSDSSASVTVNGTAVPSGSASGAVSISTGNNTIAVTVTAADGSVTNYSLAVFRLSASQKRLFVTASATNGNLGGIAGADSLCGTDANKPTDGGTYKAVIVDALLSRRACSNANCTLISENINWVLGANLTYLRPTDGTAIFTTNSAGIFQFGTASASVDAGSYQYFTGLNTDWTLNGSHCSSWTNSAGAGRIGASDQTGTGLISNGGGGCNTSKFLLCAEQ